jgi:carbon-monoxide dehydrogenase small subunit
MEKRRSPPLAAGAAYDGSPHLAAGGRQHGTNRKGGASVKRPVKVTVNGVAHSHEVEPRLLLVHFLREVLGLTGTHVGCDTSNCGACTILMNGKAIKSCTLLAVQADGAQLKTVEGLAQDGNLHPIQEGFWEEHGLQCGFCTPGMMLTALDLLQRTPDPTEEQIRMGLEGNLCRCTGYQHIVNSIQHAARKMRGAGVKAGRPA